MLPVFGLANTFIQPGGLVANAPTLGREKISNGLVASQRLPSQVSRNYAKGFQKRGCLVPICGSRCFAVFVYTQLSLANVVTLSLAIFTLEYKLILWSDFLRTVLVVPCVSTKIVYS